MACDRNPIKLVTPISIFRLGGLSGAHANPTQGSRAGSPVAGALTVAEGHAGLPVAPALLPASV